MNFNKIPKPNSDFVDLSFNHKTSFDMGKLIPIACQPVMPGDKLKISVDSFVRAMPTIFPIMEEVNLKFNYFYVPNRVVWDKWKDYQTMNNEYKFGGNAKPNVPQIKEGMYDGRYMNSRLGDYLGYPSASGGPNDKHVFAPNNLSTTFNAIPFLGYQHIYLEWYAPQRWINYLEKNGNEHPLIYLKGILTRIKNDYAPVLYGENDSKYPQWMVDQITTLRNVGWNHDYFTSCLPEPQAVSDVKLPLVKNLVDGKFFDDYLPNGGDEINRSPQHLLTDLLNSNDGTAWIERLGTINDLRQNIAIQHLLEKMNIGGGRYNEMIKTIFGVDIPDRTLQRPEYLGGDTLQIFFNEVESTAETNFRKLGELGGKPLAGGNTKEVEFFAEEFGYVYVIMHVAPRRSYANAVERHLKFGTIFDALDLPNPDMQGIGDQAVYNWEVDNASSIFTGTNPGSSAFEDPNKVFGYAPRFSEWKYSKDRFSGEFKGSLMQWHMSDLIIKETEISPNFIECKPREDVFNVPGDPDKFFGTFRINLRGTRKLESQVLPGIDYI